jgi:DUF3102 family protein
MTAIGHNALERDLAARINEAHHSAMRHADKAISQAIACGEMLLEAKAKLPHGQWLPWLRKNITFGERSAQGYMRIAQKYAGRNLPAWASDKHCRPWRRPGDIDGRRWTPSWNCGSPIARP